MKLRPYQELIRDFILENKRCNIFAGMGLGKTLSTLSALEVLSVLDDSPALVIAPKRVAINTWPDEIEKWNLFFETSAITGTPEQRAEALRKDAQIFTINYENIPWLVDWYKHNPKPWPFKTVIPDECSRLKGYRTRQGTKRAKALAEIAHTKVERWVGLTGTPASNGLKDLWGQMWFVDKGLRLGKSYTAFEDRWFRKNRDSFGVKPMPHAQEEIQGAISDVCLSLDAKDWFDLKEPIVTKVGVNLPSKARKQYKEMEKKMFLELEEHLGGGEVEALNAAAKTQKCLQIASGALYTGNEKDWVEIHDEKLQALESIIEEANGMPVLVAYHFKPDLIRLKKAFPQGREFDDKPATLKDWNAEKIPILFIHPQSAGHGLNMQYGGNIIVFFTVNWNLEYRDQIMERIGPTRQMQAGLDRPVFVYYILANDTLDYDVLERLETKASVQEILMKAMKRERK